MIRSAFAVYAGIFVSAGAVLNAGCDSSGTSNVEPGTPPAVLADLHSSSPGPWRRLAEAPQAARWVEQDGQPAAESRGGESEFQGDENAAAVETVGRSDVHDDPADDSSADAGATRDMYVPTQETDAPVKSADSTLEWVHPSAVGGDAADFRAEEMASEPLTASPSADGQGAGTANPSTLGRAPVEINLVERDGEAAAPLGNENMPRTPLPWANSDQRSPETAALARRADQRVRHGFQLAQRGAIYSARNEYIAALQLIAQANDAQQSSQFYSNALAAGLIALKESNDFVQRNPKKPQLDVRAIVGRHKTPILKGATEPLTPSAAAERYHTFAQEQLAAAAAHEIAGSMALFGLGKAALTPADTRGPQSLDRTTQAMALYQAALLADPKNFRAANELGVLAAENGSLLRARELLVQSATLSPQPATWNNLAIVHGRLGEKQLADRARAQAVALEQAGRGGSGPQVQWVDPSTFSRTGPISDSLLPPAAPPKKPSNPPPTPEDTTKPTVSTAKKGISDWLPWNPRR